jgi:hypothetical protein
VYLPLLLQVVLYLADLLVLLSSNLLGCRERLLRSGKAACKAWEKCAKNMQTCQMQECAVAWITP